MDATWQTFRQLQLGRARVNIQKQISIFIAKTSCFLSFIFFLNQTLLARELIIAILDVIPMSPWKRQFTVFSWKIRPKKAGIS